MMKHPLPEASMRPAARRIFVVMASACVFTACASGQGNSNSLDPIKISLAEIEEAQRHGLNNAYDLIQRSRPRWLQIRTERSLRLETTILVYQNDTRLGGIEVLRNMPLTGISGMRYLDS